MKKLSSGDLTWSIATRRASCSISNARTIKSNFCYALLLLALMSTSITGFSQASGFGVNLSGLEWGSAGTGTVGYQYYIPTNAELDYYNSKGLKLIRLPFQWERVQPTLGGALNTAYLSYIDQVVAGCRARNMSVILDVHNYCRYYGNVIGASGSPVTIAHFQDLWTRLASHYANEATVYAFDLMNEPSEMPTSSLWFNIAQAAINAIRTVDNNHIIMVEGDFWAHADYWVQYSDNLKNLVDPANKIVYEAHQYFDADGSGSYGSTSFAGNGANVNTGVNKVSPFINWLATNNKKGFVGEYGIPNTGGDQSSWNTLLTNFLNSLSQNCIGGTYWAGGPQWGNYVLSCEPNNGIDRPQMSVLQAHTQLASGCGIVTPPANQPPVVNITSPVNGASFTAPASITISTNASDADGSVARVDFYNGSTLLGSDATAPYSFFWNNVAAGSYTITAKAIDNAGASASSSVSVIVNSNQPINQPPVISITSPSNGTSFTAPASITITANASDSDGSVSRVDFYNGSTLLGSDATAPYSFIWSNVATGSYSITAKATDNAGAIASASLNITVNGSSSGGTNLIPVVSIITPVNGERDFTAPASITISANASDPDGSISKVDFYNGNTLLGTVTTAPYTFVWNNVTAAYYQIVVKATDNLGATAITASNIAVNPGTGNQVPTISITSPSYDASFNAPATITINANASDADGSVSRVDFYNGSTLLGSDASAPYSFTWSNVSAGSYTIVAKATDNAGAVSSASVNVSVTQVVSNQPPTVSITSPSNGASFNVPASIAINANASDADGSISRVDFYNGSVLLGSDASAPYSFTWSNVSAGSYTIVAKATDNAGAVSSASVNVSVTQVVSNQPPTVSITSPSNGSNFNAPASITINANASDADGSISRVDFYNGSVLLGSDATVPYSFNWNIAAGSYSLKAVATDNSGATTSSAPITVTVTNVSTALGINGPSCVNQNTPTSFTLSPDPGFSSASWWTTGDASVSVDPSDNRKATVNYTNNTSGTVTISCGANFSTSPWYKLYTKTISVGNCPAPKLGVSDFSSEMMIAPNPFKDQVTVNTKNGDKILSINLFDMTGTEEMNIVNIDLENITLGNELRPGIYMLHVVTESGNFTTRIVKAE